MSKVEKLMVAMRNCAKTVRFDDLASVMSRNGWTVSHAKSGSHVKIAKAGQTTIIGVVPHGGQRFVATEMVDDCLKALDAE